MVELKVCIVKRWFNEKQVQLEVGLIKRDQPGDTEFDISNRIIIEEMVNEFFKQTNQSCKTGTCFFIRI